MSGSVTEQLAALTSALQTEVPALRGALPSAEALTRDPAQRRTREVYLLGTIKSGKSTLVNALLGRDLMPRGAGVKTFNLTRARRAPAHCSRILFHGQDALRARFEFDFRMLGFAFEVPAEPYSAAGTAALSALLETFEQACREDERLADVDADASLLGLLPRSLARIRRGIAGLAELQEHWPDSVVEEIAQRALLEHGDDRFDDYLAWTESMDLAALIRGIELDLPWSESGLPANLELIDCQGSDSLNALDFADVESIVQRADTILYVIQSRLGLRQGDRDLLRHLAQAGAAERLQPVLNLDAFDPLGREDFDALKTRVQQDLTRTLGQAAPLIALSGLADLDAALGDDEELELMTSLWKRRDAEEVLVEIRGGADTLRRRLTELAAAEQADSGAMRQRVQGLIHQCRITATASLARDAQLLGTDASGMSRAEALAAVQRILDGERQRIREDAAAQIDEALAPEAALQREVDEFLASAGTRYLRARPVPEALLAETRAVRVLDAALAAFNEDWLGSGDDLRHANLAQERHWLGERLQSAHERIVRMLPPSARSGAVMTRSESEAAAAGVREDPRRAIERIMDPVAIPTLLSPVVASQPVRQALMAEYLSRGLIARMRRSASADGAELLARRVETLWRRTLAAAFRHAAEDRGHAFANARENYKFQYCYRIADYFVGVLAAEILADVERHYGEINRLSAARRLLLPDTARDRVEAYLAALDRLELQLVD